MTRRDLVLSQPLPPLPSPAPQSLALAHVELTDTQKVRLSAWAEEDFRDGSEPWPGPHFCGESDDKSCLLLRGGPEPLVGRGYCWP